MGDAPKAQEMTRGSTKVAPAFVLQPKQFVVFLDLEQPLGLTIDSCDDDPKNPAAYPAMITWVDQDGQADVGKIKMGMQIIGLAGESTEGKTSEEVVQMITDAKQAHGASDHTIKRSISGKGHAIAKRTSYGSAPLDNSQNH